MFESTRDSEIKIISNDGHEIMVARETLMISPVFRDAFNADMFLKSDGDKKPQAMKHENRELHMDGSALAIRLFCGLLEHGSLEKTRLYEALEPATIFPPSAIIEAVHLGDLYDLPFFDGIMKGFLPDLASRDSYGALAAYSVAHRMANLKLAKESLLMVSEKDWNPLALPSKIVESLGLPAWRSLVCAYNELKFVKESVDCTHCYRRDLIRGATPWVASPSSWISIAVAICLPVLIPSEGSVMLFSYILVDDSQNEARKGVREELSYKTFDENIYVTGTE